MIHRFFPAMIFYCVSLSKAKSKIENSMSNFKLCFMSLKDIIQIDFMKNLSFALEGKRIQLYNKYDL
jgi:hypothetical protein